MGTLYECLKEAKLERYYPSFRAHGIAKSEALARLTVQDCPLLGITLAEDRRRLVELISIVKAVHSTDRDTYLTGRPASKSALNGKSKMPRKRNRSPAHSEQTQLQIAGRFLSAVSDAQVRARTSAASSHHLSAAGAALLGLISHEETSESSSQDSEEEHSDYEPAVKHSVTASAAKEVSFRVRKTPVEKIRHGTGYNYGVPGDSNTGTRPKTRPGTSRLNEDKIKVCVRKRPLSKRELKDGEDDMVSTISTNTLIVSEPKQAVDLTAYTLQHEFIFDEVFEENCTNEDVYIRAARPLINCIFDGGSATCFAYGQTGAGKTHTMIGNADVPGMYLLAAHDIFSIIETGQYGTGIKVWVSFFEIYCGQLFDLLNKRNRLHAREDGSHHVCIAGLTETEATDEQSLMQVLDYGNSVRSKGATGVNPDSSRSHAVLQMEIRDTDDKRLGRISFIDLAGSERAADSVDTDRQTRMEGAEINQSLLALKECIRSIDQESRHKPFRQSKLTHILKDSFVGNSRTCMIANISPGISSCRHTLNTLRYADRVKELRRGVQSSSVSRSNVAMSNILMNIPASAPSIFQPSNILCSSTPMRQSTKQFTSRNSNAEFHLDPSETPIRGPGAKRKTSSTVTRIEARSQSLNVSTNQVSKSQVIRHVASNIATSGPTNIAKLGNQQNLSLNSESDQTDTESCNVTAPQKQLVALSNHLKSNDSRSIYAKDHAAINIVNKPNQNVPVIKSTDTENDFPTTDFNNDEQLNDLNRSGGKNKVATSVPIFPSEGAQSKLPNDRDGVQSRLINERNASQSRLSNEKEGSQSRLIHDREGTQSRLPSDREAHSWQSKMSSLLASVPILQKKNYTESQSGTQTINPISSNSQTTNGQYGNDVRGNSDSVIRTTHTTVTSIPKTITTSSSGIKSSPVMVTRTADVKERRNPDAGRPHITIPSILADSVEDDQLFDALSIEQRVWMPRTPLESSNTQPKIPQDPLLEPEIPAVLPAKSTELTTFSQSPRWQLNKNQNFKPEPHRNIPNEKIQTQNRIEPVQQNSNNESSSDRLLVKTNNLQTKTQKLHSIPKQREYHFNPMQIGRVLQLTGQNQQDSLSAANMTASEVQINPNITAVPNKDSDKSSQVPKEPISVNWFTTPADHDTHMASSVSSRPISAEEQSDKKSNGRMKAKSSESVGKPEQEETELKDLDVEFLPNVRQSDKGSYKHNTSDINAVTAQDYLVIDSNRSNNIQNRYSDKCNSVSGSYQNTMYSKPGYFSDPNAKPKTSSTIVTTDWQRVVHSPVNSRQTLNSSPVIKDFVSISPVDGKSENSDSSLSNREVNSFLPFTRNSSNLAVKTEKLQVGSIFSPIHPQPVTNNNLSKSNGPVSKDILHPTPVGKNTSSPDRRLEIHKSSSELDIEPIHFKSQLISSHEDQLAKVTSLCKQEMKLLLGAKSGNRKFNDYMKKVSEILSQKISAIQLLQDQIVAYELSTEDTSS